MKYKLSSTLIQILIYAITLSLVGGSFLLDFRISSFQLYGFRIVIILSFLILLFTRNIVFTTSKLTKYVTFFFITWIVYALISLSWCPDLRYAFKDLFYITFGFVVYLTVLSLKTIYNNFFTTFFTAWVLTLSLVILAAVFEIYTEQHLEGSLVIALSKLSEFHDLHSVPVFTFDNPNHFATYISFSICILLNLLIQNKQPQFTTLLLIICLLLVYTFSSRLAFIFIGIAITLFIWVRLKIKIENHLIKKIIDFQIDNRLTKKIIVFTVMGVILFSGIYTSHKPIRVKYDFKEEVLKTNHDKKQAESSVLVRKNLIYNGCDFIKKSNLMGVGAGGFRALMIQNKGVHSTNGIYTPHNYIIEIFAQYGIVIILFFISIFMYILYILWITYKKNRFTNNHFMVTILMLCYLLMSNANSSFLPLPINWIMFACLIVFTDKLLDKSTKDNAGEN
jgi:teichuronic acid biosynthesis protein TuaE